MGATLILSIRGNDLITQQDGSERLSYTLQKVEGEVSETSAAIVYDRGVGKILFPRGITQNTDTHSTTLNNPINIFNS